MLDFVVPRMSQLLVEHDSELGEPSVLGWNSGHDDGFHCSSSRASPSPAGECSAPRALKLLGSVLAKCLRA